MAIIIPLPGADEQRIREIGEERGGDAVCHGNFNVVRIYEEEPSDTMETEYSVQEGV